MKTAYKLNFEIFDSPLGRCGIAWGNGGIIAFALPEANTGELIKKLLQRCPRMEKKKPDEWVSDIIVKVVRHLEGIPKDFSGAKLDFSGLTEFQKKVFRSLRKITSGKVISYGRLAREIGMPKAARAVGMALSKNPFALIVPCHRVIAGSEKLGGFSAFGGAETKKKLLALEGFSIEGTALPSEVSKPRFVERLEEKTKFLIDSDPQMRKLIEQAGPVKLKVDSMQSPYETLFEAIVYQQLTAKAAGAILRKVKALFHSRFPKPEEILRTSFEKLRSAGLSGSKILAVKDLAKKAVEGGIPSLKELSEMEDEEIIEKLTQIRGIGRWTVEMLLIFRLGRLDVFPVTDYGIRKGFALTYGRKELPRPKELREISNKWRPFRTLASWYFWRANEILKNQSQYK